MLLRATLQNTFRVTYNRSPKVAHRQFKTRLGSLLTTVNPPEVRGTDWISFLTDTSSDDDELNPLVQAVRTAEADSMWHAVQVISRAFLLLRVASGATRRLLKQLPINQASRLSFWTSEIGRDPTLWSTDEEPASKLDLWTDIGDAISELGSNLATGDTFNSLWKKFPASASVLSSSERVCVWGLSL